MPRFYRNFVLRENLGNRIARYFAINFTVYGNLCKKNYNFPSKNGLFFQCTFCNNMSHILTPGKLSNSPVKSVLYYECEAWRVEKVHSFIFKCFRRMLKIRLPYIVSDDKILRLMEGISIVHCLILPLKYLYNV